MSAHSSSEESDFLRGKIRGDNQVYISQENERLEKYFYDDSDLKSIPFSKFSHPLSDSKSIISAYSIIKEKQDQKSSAPFFYEVCLWIAYSGLKDMNNQKRIFENLYDDENIVYSVVKTKKSSEDIQAHANNGVELNSFQKFLKEVNPDYLRVEPDEVDVAALKISAYCFAMLTASVKSKDSTKVIFSKIDDYINSKIYSLPSNFRIDENMLSEEFVSNFGTAAASSPLAKTLILNSYYYAKERGGKEQNLLYALALTRLVRYGLPIYTLALPIANLYARKNNQISIASILRTGLTTSTEDSIINFIKFTYLVEMTHEEYEAAAAKNKEIKTLFPRDSAKTTYFWPIARILDDRLLLCLGRAKNPDLIVFLIELNKVCETPNFQADKITRPACKYDKFEELAAAARTYLIEKNLNPNDMLPEIKKIMEETSKPKKIKVSISSDSDIDG